MTRRLFTAATLLAATVAPLLPATTAPTAGAVSCTVTEVLKPGAASPAVVCLEQRLGELGFDVGAADTVYDPRSVDAVMAFQRNRGLYPDGIVTSITARQLGLRGDLTHAPTTPRVTVIGDSTAAAMRWYDEAANTTTRYDVAASDYDLLWSVESCRRLVVASCTGRTDPGTGLKWVPVSVLPLMQTSLRGKLGQAVVIMAGYDDVSVATAIDQIMSEANAQGVAKVFWLNYRLTSAYNPAYQQTYSAHNAQLAQAQVRWPNLVVLDWNGYTYAQPTTTQQAWFAADQIHLTAAGGLALAGYIKANLDGQLLGRCVDAAATAGVPDPTTGTPPASPSTATGFVALGPTRVLDTRANGGARLGAGRTVTVHLGAALPSGSQAAVLNVTAVDPCGWGYLTVFACGVRPDTSNVNYVAGRTTAAIAITGHRSGDVCVYSSAATDVVVDLVGAFAPGGDGFHQLAPTRWVDTRGNPAQVARPGPLAQGSQIDVPVAGTGAVPAGAEAVWLNLTAVDSPVGAVVQVYPGPCATPPATSTVNVLGGRAAATSAIVQIGSNGGICVRSYEGRPQVIVDVAGWFDAAVDGLMFRVGAPFRQVDTRLPAGSPVATSDVSLAVGAVTVFNVAAVDSTGFGYVTAAPCGSANTSSLLNMAPSEPVANLGVVGPGAGSRVCVSRSVPTHLVVDVLGTFVSPG